MTQRAKEYAASGGTRCPACDSEYLTGHAMNVDVGIVSQQIRCDSCGATWYDVYHLVGYEDLEELG